MARDLYPIRLIVVLFLFLTGAQAQGIGALGEDETKASGTLRYKARGITNIEWSAVKTQDGDSETVTRVLQSLAGERSRPLVQEKETTTQIDSETTRVTRTTSNFDSRGRTKVIEVVEEEQRTLPNGEEHVQRDIMTPDSRGRLSVYRQEVQTTIPTGKNSTVSTTSIYLRGISGKFEEKERIQHSETQRGNTTEIEETTQTADTRGRWVPFERRTVTSAQKDGKTEREEEKLYRKNSKGRLTLSEHKISSFSEDAQGTQHLTVETHSNLVAGARRTRSGKLELDRRVNIISKQLSKNVEQTIEEIEQRSPGDPGAGLKLVERKTTTSRSLGNGQREVEVEVKARNSDGRMKTIMTQKTTTSD